jgi:hypothetical protein
MEKAHFTSFWLAIADLWLIPGLIRHLRGGAGTLMKHGGGSYLTRLQPDPMPEYRETLPARA